MRRWRWRRVAGWPRGQDEDLAVSLPDGSRLHAQRYGRAWRVHRDRYDPAHDPARHAAYETPLLAMIAIGVTVAAVLLAIRGRS